MNLGHAFGPGLRYIFFATNDKHSFFRLSCGSFLFDGEKSLAWQYDPGISDCCPLQKAHAKAKPNQPKNSC